MPPSLAHERHRGRHGRPQDQTPRERACRHFYEWHHPWLPIAESARSVSGNGGDSRAVPAVQERFFGSPLHGLAVFRCWASFRRISADFEGADVETIGGDTDSHHARLGRRLISINLPGLLRLRKKPARRSDERLALRGTSCFAIFQTRQKAQEQVRTTIPTQLIRKTNWRPRETCETDSKEKTWV